MSTQKISAGAASARESARKADGKFGSYQSPRADGVQLTAPQDPDAYALDYECESIIQMSQHVPGARYAVIDWDHETRDVDGRPTLRFAGFADETGAEVKDVDGFAAVFARGCVERIPAGQVRDGEHTGSLEEPDYTIANRLTAAFPGQGGHLSMPAFVLDVTPKSAEQEDPGVPQRRTVTLGKRARNRATGSQTLAMDPKDMRAVTQWLEKEGKDPEATIRGLRTNSKGERTFRTGTGRTRERFRKETGISFE